MKKNLKEIESVFFDEDNPTPYTGGNSYEKSVELTVQKQLDLDDLDRTLSNNPKKGIIPNTDLNTTLNTMFNSQLVKPYFLLKWMADYFCNTLDFETLDIKLYEHIIKIIRCSFFYGKAALIINDWDFKTPVIYGVSVVDETHNIYGELISVKIGNINEYLMNQKNEFVGKNIITLKDVPGEKPKLQNVIIFRWGIEAWSAWVLYWPFIQQQEKLLEMLYTSTYSYIKKFALKITDPTTLKTDINNYFNSKNPFVSHATFGSEDGLSNKIKALSLDTDNNLEFVEMYNQYINIYFEIFGRRSNVDEKAERNLTSEIVASQEHFNAIQQGYKNQFKIFVENINKNEHIKPNSKINFLNRLTTENDKNYGGGNES